MNVVAAETKFAPAGMMFLSVTEYPIASATTPHRTIDLVRRNTRNAAQEVKTHLGKWRSSYWPGTKNRRTDTQ